MNFFIYMLILIGCALIGGWLVVAVCFGIGIFGKRDIMNSSRQTASQMLDQTSKPVGPTQWVWVFIMSLPLLLFGAAILIVHFFSSLAGFGWCRLTGRPIPQAESERLEDVDDEDMA